jgi:hypothetical protein
MHPGKMRGDYTTQSRKECDVGAFLPPGRVPLLLKRFEGTWVGREEVESTGVVRCLTVWADTNLKAQPFVTLSSGDGASPHQRLSSFQREPAGG